ncbi:DEAD/DEAH box helicase family protein [Brevibacillus sp. SYP-B805]|uniref:DEAD/DEAH box helicase n=1 Tax=Brevibacillus sp. SYP-B805 TaxID=1578199 RepID=UPI0013ED036C|nr:helicase-related protein [Brevibacillus sp. SYP-B805]NGQ95624.1 DEAD/DEAH box helicase family protein [Brevibacillus sp. SYP-B805]
MREYILYLKEENKTTQAYITPCFAVDKLFWEQQDGQRLHIIGRSPSLAIAFMLREKMNEHAAEGPIDEAALRRFRKLAESCVRETNLLYGRETKEPKTWFTFSADGGYGTPASKEIDMIRSQAEKLSAMIAGRALLWDEVARLGEQRGEVTVGLEEPLQWLVLQKRAAWQPAVSLRLRKSWLRHRLQAACERCGEQAAILFSFCHRCRQGCAYCPTCINMGRSKCCTPYICVSGEVRSGDKVRRSGVLAWKGALTPLQGQAAERARAFAASERPGGSFLLWAVCGAGKTELLFPAIAHTLEAGKQVLIATPRKDVVLELVPRLQQAFPTVRVLSVHGASTEKWEDGDVIVATTHQVMRYYQKFPLVVVDEADAFPFHGNRMLYRAVQRAAAPGGKQLYLTATPPPVLRKRLAGRTCGGPILSSSTHVLLPQRFHGHPLPVPVRIKVPRLFDKIRHGRPVLPLLNPIRESLRRGKRLFLFVPRIADVPVVHAYLRRQLPACADRIEGVHAADPDREAKVLRFREHRLDLLVTTTILERGVTIPDSDVIVLGADNPVFDQASLVQIAGRVGRSAASPDGLVLFLLEKKTRAAIAAIREIKRMNRLAQSLRRTSDAG